jgi:hypothetical protein
VNAEHSIAQNAAFLDYIKAFDSMLIQFSKAQGLADDGGEELYGVLEMLLKRSKRGGEGKDEEESKHEDDEEEDATSDMLELIFSACRFERCHRRMVQARDGLEAAVDDDQMSMFLSSIRSSRSR